VREGTKNGAGGKEDWITGCASAGGLTKNEKHIIYTIKIKMRTI